MPIFSPYTLEKAGMRTAELLGGVYHGAALGVPDDPRVARGRAHEGRIEAGDKGGGSICSQGRV
jgi:hypothetical protein